MKTFIRCYSAWSLSALAFMLLTGFGKGQDVSGSYGDFYYYTPDGANAKIGLYTGSGGAVTIPETLIGVITGAGYDQNNGQFDIPIYGNLTVTNIGDHAFCWSALTTVVIPNSVTTIEWSAFGACSNLTSVTIPSGVTSIGDSAFNGCVNLSSIIIPNSLIEIGSDVFCGCSRLTNATIGNKVTSIGTEDFIACGLTSVNIPNSVTNIGSGAFGQCSNLASVTIGANVTGIESQAFSSCTSLTNILIPSKVTSIGPSPFLDCWNLNSIVVAPLNPMFSSAGGVLFDKNQTRLIICPTGMAGSYTVPNTVSSIATGAFMDCLGLTNVTISGSVTNIEASAFEYCTNMLGVYFLGNAPICGIPYYGIYAFAFVDDYNATGHYLTGTTGWIGTPSWNGSYVGLPMVQLPYIYITTNHTITITAFGVTSGSVTIPEAIDGLPVTTIGSGVFSSIGILRSVTIPSSVTNIGSAALASCTNLTAIFFKGNAPTVDASAFFGSTNVIIYYLPGTTGWGTTFGGRPTVLWNPTPQTTGASFGVRANRFGFNINAITGTNLLPFVVEACTNLANPTWQALQTNNGSMYFSDPKWTNFPGRYYRLRSQ